MKKVLKSVWLPCCHRAQHFCAFQSGLLHLKKYDGRKWYTWENGETSFDLPSISSVGVLTRGMTCFLHVKESVCSCSTRHENPPTAAEEPVNIFYTSHENRCSFRDGVALSRSSLILNLKWLQQRRLRDIKCCVGPSWNPVLSVFHTIRCSNSGHSWYGQIIFHQI